VSPGNVRASGFLPQPLPFGQQAGFDASTPMLSNMIPGSQPAYAGFVPELGMQMPFDPEGFFSIGNMLQDGFFNFPMDENNNFYMP
jgi:hypothetical protein